MMSREELKNIVSQFRIVELQSLLEYAGCKNVRMRKKELLKKALNLITKKRTLGLAQKIHTIHLEMCGRKTKYGSSFRFLYNSFHQEKNRGSHSSNNCGNNRDARSQVNPYSSLFKKLDLTKLEQIQFSKLSFFEYSSDIMLVTPLMPISEKNDLFEYNGTFLLKESIIENLFYDDDDGTNPQYQVLLRICLLNDETDVTDCLPPKLYVTVNDKYCSLPPPDPSVGKQGTVTKRINAPVNITGYLNRDLFINTLVIHWAAQFYTVYGVTVQLVKRRRADELVQKLKERGEQDPAVSKKIIYKNLSDDDNEIAATSLKMSLLCPLGKMLMSLPTRASTCNHLQCFDGCLYIKMNEIKSTWMCPVCNQACLFENLFVDGYFMDILRSDRFNPGCTDIQLNADGSWESVKPALKRSHNSPQRVPAEKSRDVSVVEDRPERLSNDAAKVEENPCKRLRESICDRFEATQPDNEISPLNNESLVDDLRHFLYRYDSMEEMEHELHRPLFCDPSTFSPELDCDSPGVATADVPRLSPLQPDLTSASNTKKEIILVDLTESDSENDDIRSTSSSSESSSNSFVCIREDSPARMSPPVYDIDSDSS